MNIYANLTENLKKIIHDPDFLSRHRKSEKDFTRNRLLTFPRLILFMINLIKGSIQDELDHFFKALEGKEVPRRIVTKSAFSQARLKIRHTVFVELNRRMVEFFYARFGYKTWMGLRLLAIDGSTGRAPRSDETVKHFGLWHSPKSNSGPIARLSQLYDVLNNITVDALIAPKSQGERALALRHLEYVNAGDLVLQDRGYPAFWLFALILSKGAQFCDRISLTHWVDVDQFHRSGLPETWIEIHPSPASVPHCRRHGLSLDPMTVRLVRVALDDGETEILITSLLDADKYPRHLFENLYHLRWGVEERYKALKSRLEIENFTGFSVEAVYQDFHAKIFTANLTAVLAWTAQDTVVDLTKHRRLRYRTNYTQAISKMKDVIVLLFTRQNIRGIIDKLRDLMINTIEPIRPNRTSVRKTPYRSRGFYPCYKRVR